jgi:hypothetical protein
MGEVSRPSRDVVSQLVPDSGERLLVARVAAAVALCRCICTLCPAGASHRMTIYSSEGPGQYRTKVPDSNGTLYS